MVTASYVGTKFVALSLPLVINRTLVRSNWRWTNNSEEYCREIHGATDTPGAGGGYDAYSSVWDFDTVESGMYAISSLDSSV